MDIGSLAAGLLAAAATLLAASWALRRNDERERLRATFERLFNQAWDNDFLDARDILVRASLDGDLDKYVTSRKKGDGEIRAAIRKILNSYELMSIGVDMGAIDETLVKRYSRQIFLDDLKRTKKFRQKVQTFAPNAYVEILKLEDKWTRAPWHLVDYRKRRRIYKERPSNIS